MKTSQVVIKFGDHEIDYIARFDNFLASPQADGPFMNELGEQAFVTDLRDEDGSLHVVVTASTPSDGQYALGEILICFRHYGYMMTELPKPPA